ncbi:syntaxin-7-like [Biomphalaria glabrata]|uniref:Syntaxin-7-like n=1 Tax=Biomphalaria glabrata TaxID=6526 RepID=A0A9W3BI07_BIOGL|nr:syntaxin-7-like [Biomphalaria glabrata]XP_055899066.1 syntaxin-7-like [Biomphalaria glabrata]XP_055899067.1 syntaxin-7-like [Biomphalaria glabrata]XP_055899068.1 syntaxin-7-like [Biomphalaria glabrata]
MSNYGTLKEYRDDPSYRDYRDDDVINLTEQIRSNIFKINNGANALERAMKNIGSERDSDQLRDKIHETSQTTNKIVQNTTQLLRTSSTKKADKQQKIQLDLLRSNFQDAVERFQASQKKAAVKVKTAMTLGAPTRKPLVSINEDYSRTASEESLQRTQVLKEQQVVIEDDLTLIREREERIRQLEADILDVNEIFRDLGALVNAQGEVLDTIDNNVERAFVNVESGRDQLIKAADYQRKSRKKMCCLLVILLVIAIIVTIIVVVSVKS